MRSFQVVLVAFAAIAAVSAQGGVYQRAVLYDQNNNQGNYIVVPQAYIEDLAKVGFDDRTRSVCVTGIWLFYQNKDYNTGNIAGMEYVFGRNNYCVNIQTIGGRISSLRYAGPSEDYRTSSLTLYEEDYFQGREEYTLTDLPNLNLAGTHKSIIITGNDCWTLYDQPRYQGNTVCVRPPKEIPDYTPSFLSNIESIDAKKPRIPHGSIRSIRKGCLCPNPGSYVTLSSFARSGIQSFIPENKI